MSAAKALLAAILGLAACKSAEEPRVPTTITLSSPALSFDALGSQSVVTATVSDQNGEVMSGVTVAWTTSGAAVSVAPNPAGSASTSATVTSLANGSALITVTAGNAIGQVSVNVAQVVSAIEKVSGDGQAGVVNTDLASPIVVRVTDRLGAPVASVAVSLATGPGAGSVTPGSATSDANGTVSAMWRLGTSVTAAHQLSVTAGGSSATFAATAIAGAAASLTVTAGNGQSATVGQSVATRPAVRAADTFDNPVAGVAVTFAIAAGGGSVSGGSVTSDANGIATVGSWTFGTTAGPQSLTATAGSLPAASITGTAVAGAASSIAIVTGNAQTGTAGSPVAIPPSVRVADAFNNPVQGVSVTFAVASGGGSVTGAVQSTSSTGIAAVGSWTLGSGTNTLTATASGVAGSVTFTATLGAPPAPASIAIVSGNNVGAMVNTATPIAPSVLVRDASGNPVSGVSVTFAVTSGGGSAGGGVVVTNASGIATASSWTLGPLAGPNTLSATIAGGGISGNPVTFTAFGCSGGGGGGFAITLCLTSSVTSTQRAAFESAAAKWASIVTGDLPDIHMAVAANACFEPHPQINMNVDDLLIFARIGAIDGPGGTLGYAGPCHVRLAGSLPVTGIMTFDVVDVAGLEASNRLESVILHEMGHVLGIGSMWTVVNGLGFDLLRNPSTAGGAALDTYYSGANGIAGFNLIGGETYTGGQKVPVENTGGAGTINSHWRESVLANELMTGFINMGSNPLSLLTVRSLQDMGYTVNTAAADPFNLVLSLRADDHDGPPPVHMSNDVLLVPIRVVDENGQVVRIIPR